MEEVVVYIIATHYGTYYTGITNNLQRRWKEHVAGQSSYLKVYLPKEVVYVEFCATRKIAAKKERYIKMIGAGKYLLKLRYKANFG
jgi:putative endonuclease